MKNSCITLMGAQELNNYLRTNNISTINLGDQRVIHKEYIFEIEGLAVLNVYKAVGQELEQISLPLQPQQLAWNWQLNVEQIPLNWGQLAIRALYVTGNAQGFVKLGVLPDGVAAILAVASDEKTASMLAAQPLSTEISLGADPEFLLWCDGNLLPASDFFPIKGELGCDDIEYEKGVGDHALGELRPQKSAAPHELFSKIRALLLLASQQVPFGNIEFRAGNIPYPGYPCGGHLHFGMQPSLVLLRALDQYLAFSVALLEADGPASRRRNSTFAGLGRFSPKRHGFEYKALSSWLVEPELALAIFCLTKLILNHHAELPIDHLFDLKIQKAYYVSDKKVLKEIWQINKLRLQATKSSRDYQQELAGFFERIDHDCYCDETANLREKWGFALPEQAYQLGNVVWVGQTLREKMHLALGQKVRLYYQDSVATAFVRVHPLSKKKPNALQLSPDLAVALGMPSNLAKLQLTLRQGRYLLTLANS